MIRHDNPDVVAAPDGQFSQTASVAAGTPLLFISGQVPRARDGSTVGQGDATAQAECVFGNLAALLAHHGVDFSRVLKAALFVTDERHIDAVMAVRSRYYGTAAPASTLVVVKALGSPDWLLEVEMIAAL